jgi:hypothetical protein
MYIPTLKGFAARGTPFRVDRCLYFIRSPRLSLRSNPGLKLVNAFGVFVYRFKLSGT